LENNKRAKRNKIHGLETQNRKVGWEGSAVTVIEVTGDETVTKTNRAPHLQT